jgi:hypothetical protein
MSIAATRVLGAGLLRLRLSRVDWVMEVSRVVVEWRDLKPCWDGEKARNGEIFSRMSLSKIFPGAQRREMGR